MDVLVSKFDDNIKLIESTQAQCKNLRKQLRAHGIKEYCSSNRADYKKQYSNKPEIFKLMDDLDSTREEIHKLEVRRYELKAMISNYKRKPHVDDALAASKRKKEAKENKRSPGGHTFSIFPREVRDFFRFACVSHLCNN